MLGRTTVVSKLRGGLGNQLFQWAAGYAYAEERGSELLLDATEYIAEGGGRSYELGALRPKPRVAGQFSLWLGKLGLEHGRRRGGLRPIYSRLGRRLGVGAIKEAEEFHYKGFVGGGFWVTVLDGYWQSPKYFQTIEAKVCESIWRADSTGPARDGLLRESASSVCASVHARRGDLAANDLYHSYHGCMDVDYYKAACRDLASVVKVEAFWIFSDDRKFAEVLGREIPRARVISSAPEEGALQEVLLMARCRHHVLSNSTYGWWGAYLCRSVGQVVVMPRMWLRHLSTESTEFRVPRWSSILV